jgi:phosphoglycerol transferase MdoB-like AlkP superfamily enzyme
MHAEKSPPRLLRLFFLLAGVSGLIGFGLLVAARWDPGLSDFLFWLTAIWIVLVRFVDMEHSGEQTQQIRAKARRAWLFFSVKSLLAAGLLYFLAKVLAHSDWIGRR